MWNFIKAAFLFFALIVLYGIAIGIAIGVATVIANWLPDAWDRFKVRTKRRWAKIKDWWHPRAAPATKPQIA